MRQILFRIEDFEIELGNDQIIDGVKNSRTTAPLRDLSDYFL
jgi:hypothetical protein